MHALLVGLSEAGDAMKPTTVTYDLGDNLFGQPLKLVYSRDSVNRWMWTLRREQADQRDDSVFISGLTEQNIENLKSAVQEHKKLT